MHTGAKIRSPPLNCNEMVQLPPEKRLRLIQAEGKELEALEEFGVSTRQETDRRIYRKSDIEEGVQINGEVVAKARLTTKDFKKGDHNRRETVVPTCRSNTFRIMIISAVLCLVCDHIDANTAFFYAKLMEPIDIQFLPAFPDPNG